MPPEQRPDIETLAAAIAHSPIVVARVLSRVSPRRASAHDVVEGRLPVGFDDADLAVLRWIVEEARRGGRGLFRH